MKEGKQVQALKQPIRISKSGLWKYKDRVLLAALLILGVVLRLYLLGVVPGGYHRDEAYAAWNALSLYQDGIDSSGHSFPVYFEAWAHGQNALYSYLLLPLLAVTGGHMSPLLLRIPQALVGIFTLLAFFCLLRHMFSRRMAFWGLFLLAICPWHVMMSRWGLESNLAPGFLIFGLLFFIKGLEKPVFYLLSALFYGLSLYAYALLWPILPVILLLQIVYSIRHGKMHINIWVGLSGVILLALAAPLVLFLLVNMEILPEIRIGCFSIYRMTAFRSGELAISLSGIWQNIRQTLYFLKNQDVGMPYDVIMPYGIFYRIGWFFNFLGLAWLLIHLVKAFRRRTFAYEWFVLAQLIGAGLIGCFVQVTLHKLNMLYIPLVMCQAYGITALLSLKWIEKRKILHNVVTALILCCYLTELIGLERAYYHEYREIASAYYQEGSDTCVKLAWETALETGMDVRVDAGLKYPNVLLAVEGTAREYLQTLTYSEYKPAPSQFSVDGVVFYMGIDYEHLSDKSIYVLYENEKDKFEDYTLLSAYDWYVAIPKGGAR
jgi:4-amino-4-deoxy-L-arabinose transferase-like glycosyltransferase